MLFRNVEIEKYWSNEEKKLKFLSTRMFYKQYDQAFSDTFFHGYNKRASELPLKMDGFKVSRAGLRERAAVRVQSAMARYSCK